MQQCDEFRLPIRAGFLENRLELIARGGEGNAGFLCGRLNRSAARKSRGVARLRRRQLEILSMKRRIILLGPPGSGKGTIAKRLESELGLPHVSSGDLFRQEVGRGSALGQQAKAYLDRGELVPDETVLELMGRWQRELKREGREQSVRFISDIAQWIGAQEQANRLPWPRWMYEPKVPNGRRLTYCGSAADGGPWPGCDPERYNVDGPAERLLKQGADEIVMVDMTVGGTRFWKTYDVVSMTRRVVADWNQRNGTAVPVRWVRCEPRAGR